MSITFWYIINITMYETFHDFNGSMWRLVHDQRIKHIDEQCHQTICYTYSMTEIKIFIVQYEQKFNNTFSGENVNNIYHLVRRIECYNE